MRSLAPCLVALVGCTLDIPDLPSPSPSADGLVLLVHGGGDDPTVWEADAMSAAVRAALVEPERWDVVALDWSGPASSRLQAARRGRRIGEALALDIAEADYARVQVIAHSVGAHLGHGLVVALDGPEQQLTLLDPFVGSGLVRWGFGRDRFGQRVDRADAYVNRDDGVPSTDGALALAVLVDVTALRPADVDDGHRWPIQWYANSRDSGLGLDLALGADRPDLWSELPTGEWIDGR